jgi:AcrR family transcriptional regulator
MTKGEATRERIIDEARMLFESHGHFRVSLPEIAKRVGVSHSTLYLYFKDRDALLMAVARDAAQRGRSTVDRHINPNDTALDRLAGVARGNFRMAYDPALRWQLGHLLSLFYFCSFDAKLLEAYREIERAAVDRLETILIHGTREGSWSVTEPRELARAMHDLLFGETMKAFIDVSELSEEARTAAAWKSLLRLLGIAPHPKRKPKR